MMKKLLVLDLDETLISSINYEPQDYDFQVSEYYVRVRPHFNTFMDFAHEHFDLAVWSSASKDYVLAISEILFGDQYPLLFSWSVEECAKEAVGSGMYSHSGQQYIKDLSRIEGYALNNIISLDDSPEKLILQPDNLLQIARFDGDTSDTALLNKVEILKTLL